MSDPADEVAAFHAAAKLAREALNTITVAWVGEELYIAISGAGGFWSVACPAEMVGIATEWETRQSAALSALEGLAQ